MPAGFGILGGLVIFVITGAGLCSLDRSRVDDVDPPLGDDDVFFLKLTVDLAQQQFPEIVLHKLGTKPPERRRIWHRAVQLQPAELAEQQIPEQTLRQLLVRQPIPDAQQQAAKQGQKRIARTPGLRAINRQHQPFHFGPVDDGLGVIQTMQDWMVEIGGMDEKRGLGRESLLHEQC